MPPPFTKWKTFLVRLTKSFPTIPNLRDIANAKQNDERFKMWSVMLLCTILPFFLNTKMNTIQAAPCFFLAYLCRNFLPVIIQLKPKHTATVKQYSTTLRVQPYGNQHLCVALEFLAAACSTHYRACCLHMHRFISCVDYE